MAVIIVVSGILFLLKPPLFLGKPHHHASVFPVFDSVESGRAVQDSRQHGTREKVKEKKGFSGIGKWMLGQRKSTSTAQRSGVLHQGAYRHQEVSGPSGSKNIVTRNLSFSFTKQK